MSDFLLEVQQNDPAYADAHEDFIAQDLYEKIGKQEGLSPEEFYDAIDYKPSGFFGEAAKAFPREVQNIKNLMGNAAPAAIYQGVDNILEKMFPESDFDFDEKSVEQLADYLEKEEEIARKYPQAVSGFEDIEGAGDAAKFVGGYAPAAAATMASMAPVVGQAAVGMGLLYAGGKGVATKLAKKAVKNAAEKYGKELSEDQAKKLGVFLAERAVPEVGKGTGFLQGVKRGAALGTFGAAAAAEGGESYVSLLREGVDNPTAAAFAGLVKGGLEVIPMFEAFNSVFKNDALKDLGQKKLSARILKQVGVQAPKIAVQEGITEAMQAEVDQVVEAYVTDNWDDLFSEENINELINAGLAGAIGGGVVGAGTGVISGSIPQLGSFRDTAKKLGEQSDSKLDDAVEAVEDAPEPVLLEDLREPPQIEDQTTPEALEQYDNEDFLAGEEQSLAEDAAILQQQLDEAMSFEMSADKFNKRAARKEESSQKLDNLEIQLNQYVNRTKLQAMKGSALTPFLSRVGLGPQKELDFGSPVIETELELYKRAKTVNDKYNIHKMVDPVSAEQYLQSMGYESIEEVQEDLEDFDPAKVEGVKTQVSSPTQMYQNKVEKFNNTKRKIQSSPNPSSALARLNKEDLFNFIGEDSRLEDIMWDGDRRTKVPKAELIRQILGRMQELNITFDDLQPDSAMQVLDRLGVKTQVSPEFTIQPHQMIELTKDTDFDLTDPENYEEFLNSVQFDEELSGVDTTKFNTREEYDQHEQSIRDKLSNDPDFLAKALEKENINIDFYGLGKKAYPKADPKIKIGKKTKQEAEQIKKQLKLSDYNLTPLLPEAIAVKFHELGDIQRGEPEIIMVQTQHKLDGGVMNPVIEHVGDLTNRMTAHQHTSDMGYSMWWNKVDRNYKRTHRPYGFEREFEQNINNNYRYAVEENNTNLSLDQYRKRAYEALQKYADAHKKVPVYNELQYHSREAAVAAGERRYDDLRAHLAYLKQFVPHETPSGTKENAYERTKLRVAYMKKALEYTLDDKGDLVQYEPPTQQSRNISEQQSPGALPGEPLRRVVDPKADYGIMRKNLRGILLGKTNPAMRRVMAAMDKHIKRVGGNLVETVVADELFLDDGLVLRGAQDITTIFVALRHNIERGMSNIETSLHETFHFLWNNALTDSDKAIIESGKEQLRSFLKQEHNMTDADLRSFDVEELAATAFGLWAERKINNKPQPTTLLQQVQEVFKKMYKVIRDIGRAARKENVKDVWELFDDIEEGKRALNASWDILNKRRVERVKTQVANARAAQQDINIGDNLKNLGNVQASVDELERQIVDTAAKGPLYDLGSAAQFVSNWFSTAKGMAKRDNIFASMYNVLVAAKRYTNALDAEIHEEVGDLMTLHNRGRLKIAAEALDLMNMNKQELPAEGKIKVQRGSQYLTLSKQASDDIRKLDRAFKKTLGMWERAILQKLQEVEKYKDFPEAIEAQERLISNLELDKTDPGKNKLKRAKKRLRELQRSQDYITSIRKARNSKVPYFPHMAVGEFGIVIKKKGAKKEDPTLKYSFAIIGKDWKTGKPSESEMEAVKKRWAEQYGYTGSDYVIGKPFRLTKDSLMSQLKGDVQENFELLAALMQTNDPQLAEEVHKFMSENHNQSKAATYLGKNFMQRNDTLLYSQEYDSVIPNYIFNTTDMIGRYAYRDATNMISAALDESGGRGIFRVTDEDGKQRSVEIPPNQLKTYKKLWDYYTDPKMDQLFIRKANFFWALGMNASTALIQLVGLPTIVVGAMNMYGGNPITNNAIMMRNFGLASKLMTAAKTDLNNLLDDDLLKKYIPDDRTRTAFASALRTGVFRPGRSEDSLGAKNYSSVKVGKPWMNALNKADPWVNTFMGKMIATTEETSRIAAFLSFYETLSKENGLRNLKQSFLSEDQNYEIAKRMNEGSYPDEETFAAEYLIDDTHGIFGKIGRGFNQQGIWGSLIFPFMQHPITIMGTLLQMSKTNPSGAIYTVAAIMMLGGLYGLPGWELWKEVLELLIKQTNGGRDIDLQHEIKKALVTDMKVPAGVAEGLTDGWLKPIAGFDIARRVSVPFFFQDPLIAIMQDRDNVDMFTGVMGSQIRNAGNQLNLMKSGDINAMQGLMNMMMPVAAKNIINAAYTYPTKGVMTSKGTQMMTPEEFSPMMAAYQAIGLQPSQKSRELEKRNAERLGVYGHTAGQNKFARKIANTILARNEALESGDKARAKKLDEKITRLKKDAIAFAKSAGLVTDSDWQKGFNTSIRNVMSNKTRPDIPTRRSRHYDYQEGEDIYER